MFEFPSFASTTAPKKKMDELDGLVQGLPQSFKNEAAISSRLQTVAERITYVPGNRPQPVLHLTALDWTHIFASFDASAAAIGRASEIRQANVETSYGLVVVGVSYTPLSAAGLAGLVTCLESRLASGLHVQRTAAIQALAILFETALPTALKLLAPGVNRVRALLPAALMRSLGLDQSTTAQLATVALLRQISFHSSTRALVAHQAIIDWLENLVRASTPEQSNLSAGALLTLVKLTKRDHEELPTAGLVLRWTEDELVDMAQAAAVAAARTPASRAALITLLEAITHLLFAATPAQKTQLLAPAFLTVLFTAQLPTATCLAGAPLPQADLGLDISVANILAALTAYPPAATNVDPLARFKYLAAGRAPPVIEVLTSVDARNTLLCGHAPSPIATLVFLARSRSPAVAHKAGAALHSLATQSTLRGQLLQGGAAKALLMLLRRTSETLTQADLPVVQALAKLLITTEPLLVLGPTAEAPAIMSALTSLIKPLALDIDCPLRGVRLLQFECLMALTNLASISPSVAEIMVNLPSQPEGTLLATAQHLMLHPNLMVGRAATQLACNLAVAPSALASYAPIDYFPEVLVGKSLEWLAPRVHLVAVFMGPITEDGLTRLASAGILATLASAQPPSEPLLKLLCHSREAVKRIHDLIVPFTAVERAQIRAIQQGPEYLDDKTIVGLRLRGYVILEALLNSPYATVLARQLGEGLAVLREVIIQETEPELQDMVSVLVPLLARVE